MIILNRHLPSDVEPCVVTGWTVVTTITSMAASHETLQATIGQLLNDSIFFQQIYFIHTVCCKSALIKVLFCLHFNVVSCLNKCSLLRMLLATVNWWYKCQFHVHVHRYVFTTDKWRQQLPMSLSTPLVAAVGYCRILLTWSLRCAHRFPVKCVCCLLQAHCLLLAVLCSSLWMPQHPSL